MSENGIVPGPSFHRLNCVAEWSTTLAILLAMLLAIGCGRPDPGPPRGQTPPHPVSDSPPTTDHGSAIQPDSPPDHTPAVNDGAGEPSQEETAKEQTETTPKTDEPESDTVPGLSDREVLFVDWPAPRVALMVTGNQFGFLEPCGCSGLDTQNGGLVRRSTLLRQLADRGWPVIPVDAGNQVRRFGRQAEIKFQITIEGLRNKMGYRAIAFGPDDLRLPAPELVAVVAPSGPEPSPFVCANVTIYDPSFTSRYLVVEGGGKRIGITSVLGERNQMKVNNADVTMRDAAESLTEIWPKLRDQQCDLYVLIAHASMDESIALARQFPQFPIVLTTGGAGEPTREPDPIEGTNSQLIQVGTKGMYAGVIGLFDDPVTPLRYQRIPLDSRFPDTDEMLQLLAAYQEQLRVVGFEGLGIRPQPHPSGREFVGSDTCRTCHGKEYRIWKDGLNGRPGYHAHAYETLLNPPERGSIPRNHDPECLSCHVVGWNPQRYFPYDSGFISFEQTPELINVGCENCHGPGSAHVAAENGDLDADDAKLDELRHQMVLPLAEAERTCLECHDLDNSPGFQEQGAFERATGSESNTDRQRGDVYALGIRDRSRRCSFGVRRLVAALVLAAATGHALLHRRTVCAAPEKAMTSHHTPKRTLQRHRLCALLGATG